MSAHSPFFEAPTWTEEEEKQAIFVKCLLCSVPSGRPCNTAEKQSHVARIEHRQRLEKNQHNF